MNEAIKKIKTYFDPHIETTMEDWKPCEKHITIASWKKGDILKRSGSREGQLRFILKGVGALLLGAEGDGACMDISLENDFLSDFESLNSGEPSDYYIECIKPVKLAVMSREQLQNSYRNSLTGSELGRILAEQQSRKKEMRHSLNRGPATERYQRLLNEHGELFQHVGQEHLASYIGISIQSFRRVRGDYRPVKNLLQACL